MIHFPKPFSSKAHALQGTKKKKKKYKIPETRAKFSRIVIIPATRTTFKWFKYLSTDDGKFCRRVPSVEMLAICARSRYSSKTAPGYTLNYLKLHPYRAASADNECYKLAKYRGINSTGKIESKYRTVNWLPRPSPSRPPPTPFSRYLSLPTLLLTLFSLYLFHSHVPGNLSSQIRRVTFTN